MTHQRFILDQEKRRLDTKFSGRKLFTIFSCLLSCTSFFFAFHECPCTDLPTHCVSFPFQVYNSINLVTALKIERWRQRSLILFVSILTLSIDIFFTHLLYILRGLHLKCLCICNHSSFFSSSQDSSLIHSPAQVSWDVDETVLLLLFFLILVIHLFSIFSHLHTHQV